MPENLEASSVPKVDIRRYKDVWVDYNMSLEQLKAVCKKKFLFLCIDPYIRAVNFPTQLPMEYIPGEGHVIWKFPEVQSVCFGRDIESAEVEKEFVKMDLRPLTLFEGLAWTEKYWDGESWEVMRGSSWRYDGRLHVPVLVQHDDKRDLYLYRYDCGWLSKYRFLGVRKDSP